jgi:PAS domain S-box-containing protein
MSQVPRTDGLRVIPYYDHGYADRQGEIETALESLSLGREFDLRELTRFDEFDPHAEDTDGAVVFGAASGSIPNQIEVPTVWVTPDPTTAADAIAAGATDAVTWRSGEGLELLAAKLPAALGTDTESETAAGRSGIAPHREAAYRTAERLGEGLIEVDADDRITYSNRAAASAFGDDPETLIGESVWTILSERAISEVRTAVERARAEEAPTTTEVVSDQKQSFEVTLYPDGDRLAAAIHGTNQAETREADRTMYEHLVKTVGDAVYILDEDGRFTFVNDALCEMTGYDREALLGSSVHIIKDDETVAEAEDALRALLQENAASTPREMSIAKLDVELVRKDGTRIPCTDRMTLRPLEDGSFTGTVGTLRDVSRQRRRERILNNLLEATQSMIAAETTADVADRVVDVATNTIDANGAVVCEYDPDTDTLVPISVPDTVRRELGDQPVYNTDEGPVGTAFSDGRTVTVEDPDHLVSGTVEEGTYLPIGDTRTLSVSHDKNGEVMDDERQFLELLTATAESVFDRVEHDQERRRYEAVIEAADDMLFTLDVDGAFTLATESFAAMLGRSRSELVGTRIHDVLADEAVAGHLVSTAAGSRVTETKLRSQDGSEIPTRISVTPIEGSAADGVVGTVQDLRELRLAEREASRQRRRFTELFETLTDPLIELTFDGETPTVVTANRQFVDLADRSDLQGAALPAVEGALPTPIADALDDVAEEHEPIEREIKIHTESGLRFYLLRSVPYQNEDRDRAFVVLTDITESRQQGTHLQVLHRLLRHNLRNQTNVIHGRAELIAARTDDDETATHAEHIEAASRALLDTSETARSIQRILSEGRVTSEPVPVADVRARLDEVAASVAPDTRVRIDVATDAAIPYGEAVESAVTELLDNAVAYGTPDDDSAVTVTITDRPDGRVRIAVTDDGPGIPDEEWAVVAGDSEITQLQHASGLGLWLVKWVADRHGGDLTRLDVGSDGATVAVDLPTE